MSESKVTIQLTSRQVGVLASSLGMVVTGTHGPMSYETRLVLEDIARQAGFDAQAVCKNYEDARRGWKWWKR
jgi:hypothetical protein